MASEYEPEFALQDHELKLVNIKKGFMNKREKKQYENIFKNGLKFLAGD